MQKNLKKEIDDIVATLEKSGRHNLAKEIKENWDKTAFSYSKKLNTWKTRFLIEKELLSAFEKEFSRLETPKDIKPKILKFLKEKRVLQTAPHLVATENPRMLCINWLGSLGVPKNGFYIAAMFSGIPFSNNFRPGRINSKENSINLFPANMQNALVYRSVIGEKLIESISKLSDPIKKMLPQAHIGNSYTKWALTTCQNIERKILKKDNLIFVDINEVVTEYLIQVLKNPKHIFYKIFFDKKIREEFNKNFPEEKIFYCSVKHGKYETTEYLMFSGNKLVSKNNEISLENPKKLMQELETGVLCPALIIGFLTLTFINKFKCFGSFRQTEYLPLYQKILSNLEFLKEFKIKEASTTNLTTGTFPNHSSIFPIDIISGKEFNPKKDILFGELLVPMKNILEKD